MKIDPYELCLLRLAQLPAELRILEIALTPMARSRCRALVHTFILGAKGEATLFPPGNPQWFARYAKRQRSIPPFYKRFLASVNGLFFKELSLFGLPPSLQSETPLLNRDEPQCDDLVTCGGWKDGAFMFGSLGGGSLCFTNKAFVVDNGKEQMALGDSFGVALMVAITAADVMKRASGS